MKTTSRSILKIVVAVAMGVGLLIVGIALGRSGWGMLGYVAGAFVRAWRIVADGPGGQACARL